MSELQSREAMKPAGPFWFSECVLYLTVNVSALWFSLVLTGVFLAWSCLIMLSLDQAFQDGTAAVLKQDLIHTPSEQVIQQQNNMKKT